MKESKEMYAKCLTDEYCDFTKGKVYKVFEVDTKEEYYKFANDKGETQWLRFKQCEIVNVIKDSTVKNKPSNCTREHCVIENDTCEGYMGVDFCTLKDNNPTPLEAFEIIEEVMTANMPPNYLSDELHTISKALTDYTKHTESLEELREKQIDARDKYIILDSKTYLNSFIRDINTILEGGKV